jgi:hypothetical protein
VADKRLESQEELCHVELEQVILNILPSWTIIASFPIVVSWCCMLEAVSSDGSVQHQ